MRVILLLLLMQTTALGEEVIVRFRERPTEKQVKWMQSIGHVKRQFKIIPSIAVSVPRQAIKGIRHNPHVVLVEEDAIATTQLQSAPWGIERVRANRVWANGGVHVVREPSGTGVKVAVIDTGMDYTHPDLAGRYAGGYDFVNSDSDPFDDHGHGTHVSGIIAGADNDIGVVGVAPNAQIVALKVLDSVGSGYYSDIIAGIDYCVTHGIPIANMSLGGTYGSSQLEEACNRAAQSGVLLVAASGNNNAAVLYPAKYDSVLAVGATTTTDMKASFSNWGPELEMAAPGFYIKSTIPNGGYDDWSGTSMASPHIAGVAALLSQTGMNAAQIRNRLGETATDLGDPGRDRYYGYGLVNAEAAVQALPPADNPPTIVIVRPQDGSTVWGTVTLQASADDDYGVVSVDWLVDGVPVNAPWNTVGYPNGTYTITAIATDTIGQSTVSSPISVTVQNEVTNSIHIGSLTGIGVRINAKKWRVKLTVIVVDNTGTPIPNARVLGVFTKGDEEDFDVMTDSSGRATVMSGSILYTSTTANYTITSLLHSLPYNPADDVENAGTAYAP